MTTTTIELPAALYRRLEQAAEAQGQTASEVAADILQDWLASGQPPTAARTNTPAVPSREGRRAALERVWHIADSLPRPKPGEPTLLESFLADRRSRD